ncbi:MAG: hypothetical protein WC539_04825 [Nitrospirota bacterium]
MIKRIIFIIITIFFIFDCISTVSLAQNKKIKQIYIDTLLNDEQQKSSSEVEIEKLSTKILSTLKKKFNGEDVKIYNFKKSDYSQSWEKKLEKAELSNSELYVFIMLKITNIDCIRIRYPEFKRKNFKKTNETDKRISQEMIDYLGNATRETLTSESRTLAIYMQENIYKLDSKICCITESSSDFLLQMISVPVTIIEFQIQNIENQPSYLKDDGVEKIAYAISESISKFLSYPVGSPMRNRK